MEWAIELFLKSDSFVKTHTSVRAFGSCGIYFSFMFGKENYIVNEGAEFNCLHSSFGDVRCLYVQPHSFEIFTKKETKVLDLFWLIAQAVVVCDRGSESEEGDWSEK
eukprot:CAMPEP_0114593616 /NCGR_PEP_ID=MMETSP0125-20121206/15210_1 /TAXON_ID=485358 ORGANISM="Aristerostoma sp., Strain ATCC 50986" /NCGR_SAMPLE_ID=MMETSP0125 /ASSEMBLY_ACC=CAM_ASM_000245 /LENGTH=106 /DNA_ID=CAMNT_0001792973 /DNA_START=1519 /DNA_END=1839 /DNA_ORIENTATION=-